MTIKDGLLFGIGFKIGSGFFYTTCKVLSEMSECYVKEHWSDYPSFLKPYLSKIYGIRTDSESTEKKKSETSDRVSCFRGGVLAWALLLFVEKYMKECRNEH